ncbi:MAG: hypothetical protein KJO69_05935 [Gammaproteobacteria bacterium]|nr:hypothetical protein [Gammaproteobacteria bacterium]
MIGLLFKKYQYIIMFVAAVAVLGTAFGLGYKVASAGCEKDKRKALEELIEYQNEIQEENNEINDQIIEDLKAKKDKVRVEIREVYKYVEDNPDLDTCVLDTDGLRIWNGEGSGAD